MKKQWGFILAALMAVMVMAMSGCSSGSSDTSSGGGGTVMYSITGTITSGGAALADVTVSTNGGSATTNASGVYTIGGLANGSYTLTSSKIGFTFTPATLAVTVNGANQSGQNFTATAAAAGTYSISGTITSGGSALAGVTVTMTGSGSTTTITDSSGNYSFSGAQNGNYTIAPAKTGFTFTPTTLAVTLNGANLTGQNFAATAVSGGTTTGTIQLPKTGQTTSYAAADNGAMQKGAAWPNPRFTDNTNGTVTDNLTGLVWLKNANCFNTQTWEAALTSANTLASGACGLSDRSTAGQWRVPNINELKSLVDISKIDPALPAGHPFTSVQSDYYNYYWSSSSYAGSSVEAWVVGVVYGVVYGYGKDYSLYVWPVRSGQ